MRLFPFLRRGLPRLGARVRLFTLVACVALGLPFAQFGALAHALTHHDGRVQSPGGEPKHHQNAYCESCAGFSVLGGAIPVSAQATRPPAKSLPHARARTFPFAASRLLVVYASRAPPEGRA